MLWLLFRHRPEFYLDPHVFSVLKSNTISLQRTFFRSGSLRIFSNETEYGFAENTQDDGSLEPSVVIRRDDIL